MTHETKTITFSRTTCASEWEPRCSRTILMNVAIKSAHCDCEKNLCKDWVWSKMCETYNRI